MEISNPWILPDGIEEMLPEDARLLEAMRRELLDTYENWGYELVLPPLVEFKSSLLTGVGSDLDSQTLGLTDRLSGRTLGVRADISPQAARIDAHSLKGDGPRRLCYCGTVLRAVPDGPQRSRSPIQIGAELFGVESLQADAEIIRIMLKTLQIAGVENLTLDLGNVKIFSWVETQIQRELGSSEAIVELMQDKRLPELDAWVDNSGLSPATAEFVRRLPRLAGDADVLVAARELFAEATPVLEALDQLEALASSLATEFPDVRLFFDLGELRGAHYHTGVVFAAYTPGYGAMLANGGRYNEVGRAFGRARPATGFSSDLKTLLRTGNFQRQAKDLVLAPESVDAGLVGKVAELREKGIRVVSGFAEVNKQVARDIGASHMLVEQKGEWHLEKLD